MISTIRWKKKIWTNSVISCFKLTSFTVKNLLKSKKKKNFENKYSNFNSDLNTGFQFKKLTRKIKIFGNSHIKKGSIVILLSSNLQGKKAIILNTTKLELFVISGMYRLNGIPIRRVNPRYILPTDIQIDIDDINTTIFNDEYFIALKKSKKYLDIKLKNRIAMSHNLRQTYIDRCLQKKIDTNIFLDAYLKSNYLHTSI